MSARTEHPQAHVLRWIADGLDVQSRCNFGNGHLSDWKITEPDALLAYIRSTDCRWDFRKAPPDTTALVFLPAPAPF